MTIHKTNNDKSFSQEDSLSSYVRNNNLIFNKYILKY